MVNSEKLTGTAEYLTL